MHTRQKFRRVPPSQPWHDNETDGKQLFVKDFMLGTWHTAVSDSDWSIKAEKEKLLDYTVIKAGMDGLGVIAIW